METQLLILASSVLPFAALPGIYWLHRLRDARRVRAAANAHATREIARETLWKARKGKRARRQRMPA